MSSFIRSSSLLCLALSCSLLVNSCNKGEQKNAPEEVKTEVIDTTQLKPLAQEDKKLNKLEYNPTVGKSYRYRMVQSEDMIQDDSIKAENQTSFIYTKTIKSNKDGLIQFTIRYDSVRTKTVTPAIGGQPGSTVVFNSANEADMKNEKFNMFSCLVGNEVTVTMTKAGKIEEVSGMTPIVNKFLRDKKDSIPPQQKEQLIEQMKYGFFGQMVIQELQSLPDSTLGGDMSWKRTVPQELPPYFVAQSTLAYKVSDVSMLNDMKVAKIDASLSGNIELIKTKQPLPITIETGIVKGSGSSLIEANTATTLRKQNTIIMTLKANAMNPETKKSMTMKQIKTTKFLLELVP
jgi:predicted secreted protein